MGYCSDLVSIGVVLGRVHTWARGTYLKEDKDAAESESECLSRLQFGQTTSECQNPFPEKRA